MRIKSKYKSPIIRTKKIELNFFLSNRNIFSPFLDFVVPDVYAQVTRLPGTGCFLATTKILMGDKSTKEIQNIQPGDIVSSYDISSGDLVRERVIKLLVHENHPNGYLVINNKLKVTGNHPLMVNNKNWDKAENLKLGDNLLSSEGNKIIIKSINKIDGLYKVYNLELAGKNHNFFAENMLAHNTHGKPHPPNGRYNPPY